MVQPIAKAVSFCQVANSRKAGEQVMGEVLQKMGGQTPDFLIALVTIDHDIPEFIAGLKSVGGEIPLCGCTVTGCITQSGSNELGHAVSLMALKSDRLKFEPFIVSGLATDTEKVGKTIGELVKAQGLSEEDKQLLFIFPDGLTANSNLLIKSIQGGLGYHVNILGGSAGNDFQMATKTFQFCNQDILNDSVAGVLITGDFDYHVEVSHGCKALGRPRTLTKTSANRLVEIDNEPALNTLRNIIDKSSMDDIAVVNLISFGESFQGKGYSSDMLIRAIFGFNDEEGTIQLAAQIPQGADVRIVRRDPDKVISATTEMTERLVASLKDPENAVYFYVNCAFRGTTLFGDDSGPDVTAIREIMGTDKDMMGFYSFGEFAPIQGENCFHNQTGVLLAME